MQKYSEDFRDLVRVVSNGSWKEKDPLKPWFIAQCILESSRGNSELFKKHLNPFGMHYHDFMSYYATKVSYQASDGVGDYAQFDSVNKVPYAYFMWFKTWKHYDGWEKYVEQGGFEFLSFIGQFYCPGGFKQPWIDAHGGKNYAEYIRDNLLLEAEELMHNTCLEQAKGTHFVMNRTDDGMPIVTAYAKEKPIANHKCCTVFDLEEWVAMFVNARNITVADTKENIPEIYYVDEEQPQDNKVIERIPFAKWHDCDMNTQGSYKNNFPSGLIVHFTAGRGTPEDVNSYCAKKGYTLVTIGKDGTLVQSSPLSEWGYHCGTDDQTECIGVEIINAGRLEKRDGKFFSWFGTEIPGDNVRYIVDTKEQIAGYYEMFTPEQEAMLIRLCEWLKASNSQFSYDKVIGHDEACTRDGARGRKNDPGGALSSLMPDFRNLLKKRAKK
jgi:hypothetical protein